jgi:glycerophosphoryl diester phosphodiesterase
VVLISAHNGYPRWLESGADFLEIDIRRTADGVIILSHDEPPPGVDHVRFDDVLRDAAQRVGLQLDLKEPGYEIELVRRALGSLTPDKLAVTTGMDDSIRIVKGNFPEIRAGLTLSEKLTDSTLVRIERCHADFIALDHRYLRWYETSTTPIWVWTVDDKRSMSRYVKISAVEAIITNRPDIALVFRKGRS